MAQFMRAHLQQGRLGDTRILQPSSSAAMQRQQFTNHPAVSGITYGFLELKRGGQRLLWHPGDTLFYTAALFLLPDQGMGLFVVYNRAGVGHGQHFKAFVSGHLRRFQHQLEGAQDAVERRRGFVA